MLIFTGLLPNKLEQFVENKGVCHINFIKINQTATVTSHTVLQRSSGHTLGFRVHVLYSCRLNQRLNG